MRYGHVRAVRDQVEGRDGNEQRQHEVDEDPDVGGEQEAVGVAELVLPVTVASRKIDQRRHLFEGRRQAKGLPGLIASFQRSILPS